MANLVWLGINQDEMMKYILFFPLFFLACTKKTDSDPLFSLRPRTTRLVGNWEVVRYYYYDGKKSGVGGLGDPYQTYYSIKENGDWIVCDSNFNKILQLGYWNWVHNSKRSDKETIFVLGNQKSHNSGGYLHVLERLAYTQIRTRWYFDVGDEKRYMIYEWKRHE
jgi:hypothetical protein